MTGDLLDLTRLRNVLISVLSFAVAVLICKVLLLSMLQVAQS